MFLVKQEFVCSLAQTATWSNLAYHKTRLSNKVLFSSQQIELPGGKLCPLSLWIHSILPPTREQRTQAVYSDNTTNMFIIRIENKTASILGFTRLIFRHS
ncbi:hypothetical protein L6164_003866 [Bauhinia variegata]|uniref:Uncharacterized protein n=1 Tax=Bauhinia variegata TaxID=167791 RepID=A0ACB9Q4V5_BAUVA|nr:hypothetical protein L6164_003866 [Bauhinia variegata]